MQVSTLKLTLLTASAMAFAAASTLPAAANYRYGRVHHGHHRHIDRPLTVTKRVHQAPVVATSDPWHGPAAIITAPVAVGSAIVSVPFRMAASLFPPQGDPRANPLVLIGAPVHVVGQFVQLPFYAVGSAFGAPPNTY
jgi:hypothetical protein